MTTFINTSDNNEFFQKLVTELSDKDPEFAKISYSKKRGFSVHEQRKNTRNGLDNRFYNWVDAEAIQKIVDRANQQIQTWQRVSPTIRQLQNLYLTARKVAYICDGRYQYTGQDRSNDFTRIQFQTISRLTSIFQVPPLSDASIYRCINQPLPFLYSIFIVACKENASDLAVKLAKTGMGRELRDKYGNTPLLLACKRGVSEAALELIDQGANIHAVNHDNENAFFVACNTSSPLVAKKLLASGAAFDLKSTDGITPLMICCMEESLHGIALQLIDMKADINSFQPTTGNSILIAACLMSASNIALKLIEQGVDIHHKTIKGETALMAAASRGLQDVVNELIRQGADVGAVDSNNSTALFYTCEKGEEETALTLIRAGSPVNIVGKSKKTALALSARAQLYRVVEKLVENGAETRSGCTVVHLGCDYGDFKLVEPYRDKIDFTRLNNSLLAPFEYALITDEWKDSPQKMKEFFLTAFKDFFAITERVQSHGVYNFLKYFTDNPNTLLWHQKNTKEANALEVAFLFQSIPLARALVSQMTDVEFEESLQQIAKKYPKSTIDQMTLSPYELTTGHFLKGVDTSDIPEKPEGIKIQDFLQIFEEIDSTDFKNRLYDSFYGLIDTVVQRKFIRGAPGQTEDRATPALTAFYRPIVNALGWIIHTLQQEGSVEKTTLAITELSQAAGFCAGKIYPTVIELYYKIVKGTTSTFEEKIFKSLAEFRFIILQSLAPKGPQNVHDGNRLIKLLGTELGISGTKVLTDFDDIYLGRGVDKEESRDKFFKLYTPYSIITEWLYPEYSNNDDLRSTIIDWSRKNIPDDFKSERYTPIKEQLAEQLALGASVDTIILLLKNHGITVGNDSFKEAIENDRIALYHETEVTEYSDTIPFRIRKSYFTYILTKIGVFDLVVS